VSDPRCSKRWLISRSISAAHAAPLFPVHRDTPSRRLPPPPASQTNATFVLRQKAATLRRCFTTSLPMLPASRRRTACDAPSPHLHSVVAAKTVPALFFILFGCLVKALLCISLPGMDMLKHAVCCCSAKRTRMQGTTSDAPSPHLHCFIATKTALVHFQDFDSI
jgi:hypothetical protein